MKQTFSLRLVLLLFLVSGMSGLIYQVVWVRMFGLVFGNTLFASSTVLSSFMAGLCAGSYFAGKYLSRRGDCLRLYSLIELFIGVSGALMPFTIQIMSGIYGWMYQSFHPSFAVLTGIRFCFSFVLLFIPCTFMGATLPLLSTYAANVLDRKVTVPAKLYGINTVGAVIGCFTAGFVLIKAFGIAQTNLIAALGNGIAAIGAYILFRRGAKGAANTSVPSKNGDDSARIAHNGAEAVSKGLYQKVVLMSCVLSGFAALSLEIAWTKALARTFQLVWSYNMDTYAFVAMLGILLAGIGAGSYLVSIFIHRIKNIGRLLYGIQFLLGISVLASIHIIQNPLNVKNGLTLFVNAPAITVLTSLFVSFLGAQALMQLLLAVIIILIPAVLMGIAFPLYAALFFNQADNIGKSVGTVYAANTMGGILGSLGAGFVLIPAIGLLPTIGLSAGFYCITFLALLFIAQERGIVKWVTAAAITGIVSVALFATEFDYSRFLLSTLRPVSSGVREKITFFKEHADGAILIKEGAASGKVMFHDGVTVAASAGQNLFSHIFPAHLISLLSKGPREILVIGFGCGITSGSMLLYDDVTQLTGVEISSGIIEPAKRYFSAANNSVFSNKKLDLIIQDGKNFITMTDKRFDVIYASPSLPQANQGSAGLFTKEFFAECKKKLKKDGFQCVWIPLHMYSPEEFLTIVKTVIDVYPHVSLWHPPQTEVSIGLAYLVCSEAGVLPDYQIITEKLNRPGIIQDINRLDEATFGTPEEFIALFAMGEKTLKRITADITTVNTDNHPVVEFYTRADDLMQSAIMSKIKLIEMLGKNSEYPYQYIQNVPIESIDMLNNR